MPRQTVQEYLGVPKSWKVKENIRHEIVLMPSKMDIRRAKRQDPRACALHNAACRVFDIPNCAIGGQRAYIPQRDPKGNYYIARVMAPPGTQRAIRTFDKTGEMPEGGFRFVPVTKSMTTKAMRAYYHKWSKGEIVHARPNQKRTKKQKALRSMPRGIGG